MSKKIRPIPSHWRGILAVDSAKSDEYELNGTIRCFCGCEVHTLLYVANLSLCQDGPVLFPRIPENTDEFFVRIGAQCSACAKVHLIFDDDFHGYNGYACAGEEQRARPRPAYETYTCHRCQTAGHRINVCILSNLDKEELMAERYTLDESNWHEAFGWLTVAIFCNGCADGPRAIFDYKTR